MYDVAIIGAGVCGCAVARELSRYQLAICVIEKESDVCEGTSKANSAIVHAGFDAPSGSLMAKLNVQGNKMMKEMAEKLDFPFRQNGSMVVCQNEEEMAGLRQLLARGEKNGVEGMKLLSRKEAIAMEPNLSDTVYAALLVQSGGIVCPFLMNIAYAENASENGVEFRLETTVESIEREKEHYRLITDRGILEARYVVNAAGVYADTFHNMVSSHKIRIVPRKGEYCLFDKSAGKLVSHTIFQIPGAMGKGVLVTPTVHGNLLVGPTAVDVDDKESTSTTAEGIRTLFAKAERAVKKIPARQVITSFSGLRAHEEGQEFIIEEVEDAEGFFDVAGIQSPGLSCAPAIGLYVRELFAGRMELKEKKHFVETRKGIPHFAGLLEEEKERLIRENPAYGRILCRCETVTEGEILEAIHRPVGARTLDGIKRRTRAGMGRCQAGFCSPRVMEILARELNLELHEIRKNRAGSEWIVGTDKEWL